MPGQATEKRGKKTLSFERFIASRLSSKSLPGFTRPLIRIAIAGVALSMAVMILSVSIVRGFQSEIRDKVVGFSGHIQISRYDANQSFESSPVSIKQAFYPRFTSVPEVNHIQTYATKAGIIKTDDQIQGTVLKGVGPDYDWSRFSGQLLRGSLPFLGDTSRSDEVLISSHLAELLLLDTGMNLRMYFVSGDKGQLRGRRFLIAGIFETGMEEFDRLYVIGDIRHVQHLNYWEKDQVSGFELFIDNLDDLTEVGDDVYSSIGYDLDARTVDQLYPQIFEWLRLQDMNVLIILILMILVSSITMISALLIIILERTGMIGVLKSVGASDGSIRRIFLMHAGGISFTGLILGNLFGLGLAILQQQIGLISLPQESYYVSQVPVKLEMWAILLLNAGTLLASILAMLIPVFLVSRIQPIRVIAMR